MALFSLSLFQSCAFSTFAIRFAYVRPLWPSFQYPWTQHSIRLSRADPRRAGNLVDIDNIAASAHVTEYLIEQDHTRIVHFAGASYSGHSEQRLEGVRRSFSRFMLAFTDENVPVVGFDDVELSRCLPWQLSTVSVPKREMGELAARS